MSYLVISILVIIVVELIAVLCLQVWRRKGVHRSVYKKGVYIGKKSSIPKNKRQFIGG